MASKTKNQENENQQPFSGFLQILMSAGLSLAIATAVTAASQEDEKIIQFIKEDKRPLIYMTQQDSKVDDKICLPLEGTVWDRDDPNRPKIPISLHPHCRCFWIDGITQENLGQF